MEKNKKSSKTVFITPKEFYVKYKKFYLIYYLSVLASFISLILVILFKVQTKGVYSPTEDQHYYTYVSKNYLVISALLALVGFILSIVSLFQYYRIFGKNPSYSRYWKLLSIVTVILPLVLLGISIFFLSRETRYCPDGQTFNTGYNQCVSDCPSGKFQSEDGTCINGCQDTSDCNVDETCVGTECCKTENVWGGSCCDPSHHQLTPSGKQICCNGEVCGESFCCPKGGKCENNICKIECGGVLCAQDEACLSLNANEINAADILKGYPNARKEGENYYMCTKGTDKCVPNAFPEYPFLPILLTNKMDPFYGAFTIKDAEPSDPDKYDSFDSEYLSIDPYTDIQGLYARRRYLVGLQPGSQGGRATDYHNAGFFTNSENNDIPYNTARNYRTFTYDKKDGKSCTIDNCLKFIQPFVTKRVSAFEGDDYYGCNFALEPDGENNPNNLKALSASKNKVYGYNRTYFTFDDDKITGVNNDFVPYTYTPYSSPPANKKSNGSLEDESDFPFQFKYDPMNFRTAKDTTFNTFCKEFHGSGYECSTELPALFRDRTDVNNYKLVITKDSDWSSVEFQQLDTTCSEKQQTQINNCFNATTKAMLGNLSQDPPMNVINTDFKYAYKNWLFFPFPGSGLPIPSYGDYMEAMLPFQLKGTAGNKQASRLTFTNSTKCPGPQQIFIICGVDTSKTNLDGSFVVKNENATIKNGDSVAIFADDGRNYRFAALGDVGGGGAISPYFNKANGYLSYENSAISYEQFYINPSQSGVFDSGVFQITIEDEPTPLELYYDSTGNTKFLQQNRPFSLVKTYGQFAENNLYFNAYGTDSWIDCDGIDFQVARFVKKDDSIPKSLFVFMFNNPLAIQQK